MAGNAALTAGEATLIGGTLLVGGKEISDVLSGHISSGEEYRRAALSGSISGFLTGASMLALEGGGIAACLGAGFGVGFTQEAADSYLKEGKIDWANSFKNGGGTAFLYAAMFGWGQKLRASSRK